MKAMQCLICHKRAYSEYCVQHKPRKPIVLRKPLPPPKKRIKQRGKGYDKYELFKHTVAIPYLDATFGRKCQVCGTSQNNLDINHIKKRGSHPELKYELTNLEYVCRKCHVAIT